MKEGIYYIGDLCYVLHDEWDEVCEHIEQDGQFTLRNGTEIVLYTTAYGDGTYVDQANNEYSVDSGTIGAVLLSAIDQTNSRNRTNGGNIVQFKKEWDHSSNDGFLTFGHIVINTV
jgi:hypothetical protein